MTITDEMVEKAFIAHSQATWRGEPPRTRSALEAVAPMIRKAALEEAAKWHDYQAGYARSKVTPGMSYRESEIYEDSVAHHECSAAAIRTLADKEGNP